MAMIREEKYSTYWNSGVVMRSLDTAGMCSAPSDMLTERPAPEADKCTCSKGDGGCASPITGIKVVSLNFSNADSKEGISKYDGLEMYAPLTVVTDDILECDVDFDELYEDRLLWLSENLCVREPNGLAGYSSRFAKDARVSSLSHAPDMSTFPSESMVTVLLKCKPAVETCVAYNCAYLVDDVLRGGVSIVSDGASLGNQSRDPCLESLLTMETVSFEVSDSKLSLCERGDRLEFEFGLS